MKYENFDDFLLNLNDEDIAVMSNWREIEEKKRKMTIISNVMSIVLILMFDVLVLPCILGVSLNDFFANFQAYQMGYILPILIFDLVFYIIIYIIIVGCSFSSKKVKKLNKEYKEKIINKLLENFVDELDYVPLKGLPKNIYDEAQIPRHYNRYVSDDYFEGKIDGKKIVMADLLVEEITRKKDKDGNETEDIDVIFNGLFGKIDLDKSIESNVIITQDIVPEKYNPWRDKISCEKVEMDYSELEKKVDVCSDNKIIAMQLLTSDIQEEILELYNKYKIKFHISVFYDKLYVLFSTGSMFDIEESLWNISSKKRTSNDVLKEYFDIMKFTCKLIDTITNTIENTQI